MQHRCKPVHICGAPREERLLLRSQVAPICQWQSRLLSSSRPISVILASFRLDRLIGTHEPMAGNGIVAASVLCFCGQPHHVRTKRTSAGIDWGCGSTGRIVGRWGISWSGFAYRCSPFPHLWDRCLKNWVSLPPSSRSTEGGASEASARTPTSRWGILSKGVDLKVCTLLFRSPTEHKPDPIGRPVLHPQI